MGRYAVRRAAAGVALAALTLAVAGCSGNGGGIKDAAKGDQPTSTAPTAASGVGTPPQPVDTRFTGSGSAEYCKLARTYADAQSKLNPTNTTPDLRQLFQDAARDIKAAVAVAPAEINKDVQVVAEGFNALVTALASVNYDFTRLSADLIARFQSQDFMTASTRVGAYAKNVCGVAS